MISGQGAIYMHTTIVHGVELVSQILRPVVNTVKYYREIRGVI